MSLYTCIDRLDKEIQKIEQLEKSLSWLFTKNYLNRLAEEKELAQQLRASLTKKADADRFSTSSSEFDYEFNLIKAYQVKYNDLPSYLKLVQSDLRQIFRLLVPSIRMPIFDVPINYQRHLSEYRDYHIANVQQQLDFRGGLDKGNCFGYTYAMIDPELTPYGDTEKTFIPLNRKIYDYQNNQFGTEQKITRQRLTRRIFCPDLHQQAEQLWATAAQHPDSDLMVVLQARKMAHATYLSVRADNSIRYMDPNIGAYLFKDKKEFINFYQEAYKTSYHFKFYQLNKLQYDPEGKLTEEKTFSGLIRTILTGEKRAYSVNAALLSFGLALGMYAALQTAPLLFFAASPLVVQNISSFIGIATVLSNLGGVWSGYKGLLGGSHFIQEVWYDTVGHRLSQGFFSQKPEHVDEKELPSTPNPGIT